MPEEEEQVRSPAWQSARSEAWARGEKDENPRSARVQRGHSSGERRVEGAREGRGAEPVRALPGDTPAMVARRRRLQRREPGESLLGDDASSGFQMEE